MNQTLRFRLTTSVVAVLGLVLLSFSLLLYASFRRALWKGFDDRLDSEASTLVHMVEEHTKEHFDFEYEAIASFEQKEASDFFEIWTAAGTVLGKSRPLGKKDLARHAGDFERPIVTTGVLPDGRPGRWLQVALIARWDSRSVRTPPANRKRVTLVVARETKDVENTLAKLRFLLWGLGSLAMLVAGGATAFMVSRGLRPALDLAAALGNMDDRHLATPILVPNLPRELEPPVAKLNELLAHLDESFARERRFTSDVSHELRTPLSGLRSILEVAAMRDRSIDEYKTVTDEALLVVKQMHGMVENLLMLARLDAKQIELQEEEIDLRSFVADCWRPHAPRALERQLRFSNDVAEGTMLVSDRDKLRLVVSNLLSNAAEYTAPRGLIHVRGGSESGVVLDIIDTGPAIPESAMPRLFERFFRVDSARNATGSHCGIGLALVKALCGILGLRAEASNLRDGQVRFRLAARVAHVGAKLGTKFG